MKKKILVVGLNPAWQKILVFEDLVKGEVNRALSMMAFASGKGANFAKITCQYGNEAVLGQFLGGDTGKKFAGDLDADGISFINQVVKSPTRTCITLLSSLSHETELIEPSGKISEEESSSLLNELLDILSECDGVAVCGTYPPGVGVDFYVEIAKLAKKEKIPLLIDSYKEIIAVLEEGVDILKINRKELAALSEKEDVYEGGNLIIDEYPVKNLAITDGGEQAYLFSDNGVTEHSVNFVDKVVNPIGAGDTVSAVLFSEYLAGTDLNEAFDKALAAGSESCRNLLVGI